MQCSDLNLKAPRALAARSAALDFCVETVVCIPTFRRPQHLQRTLQSLALQRTERRFAVVIVENDATGQEGANVAAAFLEDQDLHDQGPQDKGPHDRGLQGICLVEPRQGNCHAINAAFETALAAFPSAAFLLMIDDDEIASPDWLERMVASAEATGADLVGGPVVPKFADDRRPALSHHPAFRPPYDISGPVPIIFGSGNCLITRAVFERLDEPTFDLRFNFLGGGDLDFFTRCRRSGMTFHWAADAVISETVPPSRVRSSWLALRGLRIGAINYRVQHKAARTVWLRVRLLLKMLALFPLSLHRATLLYIIERHAIIAMHPIAVAIGGALAAVGIELQPYKASKIVP
jgi:GT2 family glycosyltransferase